MIGKLNRENGEVVILTEKELNSIYWTARIAYMKDYICDMLNNSGKDPGTIGDEKVEEIAEEFLNNMCDYFGDRLGELEWDVFNYTIENNFPEYEEE